jgi:hypothetical protein
MESVSVGKWFYFDGPEAVASYDGVRIAAHSSRINRARIYVNVLWPNQTLDFLGEFTAEELQLPSYIYRHLWGPDEFAD